MKHQGWASYLLFTLLWAGGILGSLWTARAEGNVPAATVPPAQPLVFFSTPVPLPSPIPTLPPGITPSPTVALCQPPEGWQAITVTAGDTLESIATRYHTTAEALREANCLPVNTLMADTLLYVPPRPATASPTPSPTTTTAAPTTCGHPWGWIIHIVQPGENLYRISLAYRINVSALQAANCLPGSMIYVGQRLWVPNVPTSTPTWTPTPTPTLTPTSTATPTATFTATPTDTPTPVPTDTPEPTDAPEPTSEPTETTSDDSAPTESPTTDASTNNTSDSSSDNTSESTPPPANNSD